MATNTVITLEGTGVGKPLATKPKRASKERSLIDRRFMVFQGSNPPYKLSGIASRVSSDQGFR